MINNKICPFQPFWPQGTGCARGFLGAFDAAWMIKNLKINKRKALDVIAERESVYKILSTTTSDNIRKEYSKFTIDPKTRFVLYPDTYPF